MSSDSQPIVFETMRTYHGRVRAYPLHLKRLFRSWTLIYGTSLYTDSSLSSRFKELETKLESYIKDAGLSIGDHLDHLDQSQSSDYHKHQSRFKLERVLRVYLNSKLELEVQLSDLDHSYVNRAIELKFSEIKPVYPPAAKQSDRQAWSNACQQLKCDEIILCDSEGAPLESNNSNLWGLRLLCTPEALQHSLTQDQHQPLKNTIWQTPPADGQILAGITRSLLIDIFRSLGAQVKLDPFGSIAQSVQLDQDAIASEQRGLLSLDQNSIYFLSSTLKSLSWVKKINDKKQKTPVFLSALFCLVEKKLSQA